MKYIECPENYEGNEKSLFLAGGITGTFDWQSKLVGLLKNEEIVLLNPRRKNYCSLDKNIEEEQIKWEYDYLDKANAVSFWFTPETLCPITLYELGKQSAGNKKLFIGIHPDYVRKRDVEIQTKLIRPDVEIVYSLENLAIQIKKEFKTHKNKETFSLK
jgi:nucleoside 2-deoxyribosyltransferase-like protein